MSLVVINSFNTSFCSWAR